MRAALLLLVSLSSTLVLAQAPGSQFSADLLISPKGAEPQKAKIFFGKDKVRLEMKTQGQEMVMISDVSKGEKAAKSYMLMPQQKMVMDLSGPMGQAMGQQKDSGGDLRSIKRGNPCAGEKNDKLTCKKLGSGKIDGRKATQWEIDEKDGMKMKAWIDDELHVMLKGEMENGDTTELKNLKPGPQPASLFELPKDYKMMDLSQLAPGAGQPGGKPKFK